MESWQFWGKFLNFLEAQSVRLKNVKDAAFKIAKRVSIFTLVLLTISLAEALLRITTLILLLTQADFPTKKLKS